MHIAFLDANTDPTEFARQRPKDVAKFEAILAPHAPDWRFSDFTVHQGHFPDDIGTFDGVMISGSPSSVNDPDAWVERLMHRIRTAVDAGVPVFGACFGHQAVAKALGGTVGYNPNGWFLGRYETENHSPAPWMTDAPARMALHAAHKEQVQVAPKGARILAGTAETPRGHLAIGNKVFTTQYHPELDQQFMLDLYEVMADGHATPEELDRARASMRPQIDSDLMARWIVAFFAQA